MKSGKININCLMFIALEPKRSERMCSRVGTTGGLAETMFSDKVAQYIAVTMIGGAVSEAAGGDFLEGAVAAAMVHLFNDSINDWKDYRDPDKLVRGDPLEKAQAADKVSKYTAFLAAITKNPILAGMSTVSTINKHLLYAEAGSFNVPDSFVDFVLEIMPMPTEFQNYIFDTGVGEFYDYLKDAGGEGNKK